MRPAPAIRAGAALAALVATVFPGPVFGQARTESTVLMSTNEQARADQEQYGYADAVIAGDLIFLSGIVAGRAPGETDLVPAYERVFRHIGAILKRAGADYEDIVDITSFHTDITAEIGAMSEVQKRHLKSPPPAWTAIDIDRLLPDGGVTEIKVIARRPGAARSE
ncbi:Rid family hydrolase [Enterovirga sp. GCM10030262]|uniref:Rid family hydrolase n=1 Tax=Enterovirga sp. GCM10030262 TaxID=3273391 RepID=UPI0036111601